jgi:hypothetical protein
VEVSVARRGLVRVTHELALALAARSSRPGQRAAPVY